MVTVDSRGPGTNADPDREAGLHRFRMESELGRGGMGVVNLAADPALRRHVAVKLLLDTQCADTRAQFIEEAQITGQLEHPNIVPVHEFGFDPRGRPYLAMKRVLGSTLAEIVARSKRAATRWVDDAPSFLEIFGKVCDAVAYAHSRGVVHRDLKPDNIMVGSFGEVLLMDWGLARPLSKADGGPVVTSDRRETSPVVTMQGEVFGTPAYMPPEQARGEVDAIDERSDVFALGGILYTLLSLEPPYPGRDVHEVLDAASRRRLVQPRQRAPKRGIPGELQAIAMKAMARRPADRYASAAELKADIHAHMASLPLAARRDAPWTRIVKWARRHPTTTLAGTVVTVFALVVVALWLQLEASRQSERAALAEARAREQDARVARAEAQARAAEQAAAEARAKQAEAHVSELGQGMQDMLDPQTRANVDEFFRLWHTARKRGQTVDDFAASLTPSQVEAFLAAYNKLFEVHRILKTEPTAQQYYDRGMIRWLSGDAGSVADFDKALEADPDFVEALDARGVARYRAGDPAGALEDHNRCLALEAGRAVWKVWYNRAVDRVALRDFEGAVADYTEALELNPHSARVWCNRGAAKSEMGDARGGLADLDRALELDPEMAYAYINRGSSYLGLGDPRSALADLDRAIRLDARAPQAWSLRGAAKHMVGDLQGALADLDQAIQLQPDNPTVWRSRGRIRQAANDLAGAIADYDRAIELAPGFVDAWISRGGAREAQRDFAGAMADFNQAIRIAPHEGGAYNNRGSLKRSQGDLDGAIADYNLALERSPRLWQAQANRGLCRANTDRDAAIADLQQAYRNCPSPAGRQKLAGVLRSLGGTVPR